MTTHTEYQALEFSDFPSFPQAEFIIVFPATADNYTNTRPLEVCFVFRCFYIRISQAIEN